MSDIESSFWMTVQRREAYVGVFRVFVRDFANKTRSRGEAWPAKHGGAGHARIPEERDFQDPRVGREADGGGRQGVATAAQDRELKAEADDARVRLRSLVSRSVAGEETSAGLAQLPRWLVISLRRSGARKHDPGGS
jgi:hypothetical protein